MRKIQLISIYLLLSIVGYAQTRTITGTVYEGYNYETLIGCSVILEGTTTGTITDIEGRYSLTIPVKDNQQLRFSYLGYETEYVRISETTNTYDIRMREYGGYRRVVRNIRRAQVSNADPHKVKDIRGRLMQNYTSDGWSKAIENREIEVLSQGIKVKTDKKGYFYLKAVTDADYLKDVATGETVLVAEVTDSVLKIYPDPVFSHLTTSKKDTLGVLFMTNNMPASYQNIYLNKIEDIKDLGKNKFSMTQAQDKYKTIGQKISFTSYIDVGIAGKSPKLQTKYAQGRNGEWQGADRNEVFSWGPAVSNLEYSNNGNLVPIGEGNGAPAKQYDSKDFFKTGISFGNYVNAHFATFGSSILSLKLGQNRNNSTIQDAYKESYNASITLEKIRTGAFESEVGALFKTSYGRLTQQGANLSSLLHSVLTTPVTFDNGDKQSSYAPGYVHNPYMLASELPDRDKNNDILAYLKTKRRFSAVETSAMLSYDKQWNKKHSGIFESLILPERLSYRNMHSSNIMAKADMDWQIKKYDTKINGFLSYGFKHTEEKVNRNDHYSSGSTEFYFSEYNKLIRNAHDIKYGTRIINRDGDLTVEAYNKHYFSNTAKSSDYVNLFPELGASWNMERFIENLFDRYNRNFILYGSVGRSIGESSLIYRNPAVLSTLLNAKDFRNYSEYSEIYSYKGLKPETYLKSEIGLRYHSPSNKFSGEANVFYYNTHNYIAPVIESGQTATLNNVGRLRNYGYFLSAGYTKYSYGSGLGFEIKLNFSQTKNKVSAVYGDRNIISLAGFTDIQTVFAKGQPLGAIYGTTYLRNDKGQQIIDAEGYPMVDNVLKKIGDPTPDFILSLNPTFWWKNFTFSFVLEYNHGGDRWNGTQAILDYQGMSENSARNRDIKQYIFKGVDVAGNVNSTPVDFYNPNLPLSENRWVRYGTTGVGEEYIQDASFLRLSNVMLTYSVFRNKTHRLFKSMKVNAQAQNLFVISPYKGVDPSSLLFGYSSGFGLDLFNLPSTRSYSLSLTLEF
ncbi:hypothetical protein M2451_002428 [Dysgonomonas sp. PFB1-18]|uniref:carboxypeptidase-like regulatory domain-containing protein n=1 Tax=unclassified Dysgonomonas TaxID=2630389 RepID=UPI00247598CB|nr:MULTISPECIES: carboxypeptidase-like regulatory domain-containing protein [unclassified Dysgonomonas]MDH6307194.1 hypothetical protein [Dysgonomonas sp. PF1-14]MDH6337113.1 hypothetical protein [Dysgonomonas sp. PF1-16]MDH6381099.1 hypothetical protein [Dysgonomonas sp. PFB1-18]MDH6396322.1 hypothetical protein [Dysgonomonas sp. PF1-23]